MNLFKYRFKCVITNYQVIGNKKILETISNLFGKHFWEIFYNPERHYPRHCEDIEEKGKKGTVLKEIIKLQ